MEPDSYEFTSGTHTYRCWGPSFANATVTDAPQDAPIDELRWEIELDGVTRKRLAVEPGERHQAAAPRSLQDRIVAAFSAHVAS